MVKAELGDKQVCPSCGAKFYDLGKRPAVCPKCQTAFDPSDESIKPKRVRSRAPVAPAGFEEEEDEDQEADSEKERDEDSEDGDEGDDAPELDEAVEEPVDTGEEEDEVAVEARSAGDEIPEGFSEDDEDLVGDDLDEDDAGVLIEDGEEDFGDEELPGADDEDPEKEG